MARYLDLYISRKIIVGTVLGILVLCLVMILGNLLRELRPLLVDQNAPGNYITRFILSLIPYCLAYVIPWGFLFAVILVFGRLSAENELVSMRMSGLGLGRIALPVFVIGTLLSLICLFLNTSISPRAKDTLKYLLYHAVRENPQVLLNPGVVQSQLGGWRVLVEEKHKNELKGLHLYEMSPGKFPTASIYSKRASLKILNETKQIWLRLNDSQMEIRNSDGSLSMPHIAELEPLLFDFSADQKRKRKPNTMTNAEIRKNMKTNTSLEANMRDRLRNEIHRRYAFSFSCLALSLVALPLGINFRRKETSTGIVLSMLVALLYFSIFMIAHQFEKKDADTALVLLWLPNLICLILGGILFKTVQR